MKTCNMYRKSQIVFHENAMPIGLYCIYEGSVKISKLNSNGREQIMRIAGPGDFLGYRSLIAHRPYTDTAVAIEDATICLVPKSEFFNVMQNNKKFYEALLQMICKDADEMETKLGNIAYKPVRGRIAEALVLLAGKNQFEKKEDKTYINLTREDLASLVGTVKETAIRTISEFKDENLIEIDKRRIRILDFDKLLYISSLYD
ncbi:MAG: Crp/Fnr family transcriptional regulator [Thermoflexibacter sp.]|nr:Crp/Fnr family transcriptional regulator [Thermoflexibacter sp.]